MSTERFYVCLDIRGSTQYYQREAELPDGKGKFVVKPYFTDRTQAVKLGEDAALFLSDRLRKLGQQPWLEKMDGSRVDPPRKTDTPVAFGDDRQPVMATLDLGDTQNPNARWFVVRPANTPQGPRWYLLANPPGLERQTIYADSPLLCLERAAAIQSSKGSMLDWAERTLLPKPKTVEAQNTNSGEYRKRPGELR